MATGDKEKAALDALQKKIHDQNEALVKLKGQKASAKKPSTKDKKKYLAYQTAQKKLQAQIDAATKALTTSKSSLAGTQNKYYVATGQYDQLLKGTDRDAYMAVQSLFKSFGLGTLASKIYDYVKNGYSSDTISILLQDTDEYKKRFAGNEARAKAGLPVLSPAEYLSTESSYKQIMQQAGLPEGFYDSPDDFTSWIGKNVSPSEIQSRVDLATQATTLANPMYRKALNQMGISDSELTAYFLDQNRALPILQKAAATAAVGAESLRQGLGFDQTYAEQLATSGVTADQAKQGYSQVAGELETMRALGNVYGSGWTQRESEQSVFEGNAAANQKKNRLMSAERGNFSGATGGSRSGLSQAGGNR